VPRWHQITFREVPEEGTRIAQLKRGEIDLTHISLQRVKEVEQAGLTVLEQPGAVHVTMWPMWGLTPDGHPLRNPKVREALNLAINRQEIIKALFAGRGTPSSIYYASPWAVKPLGFDESPYQYPFDPQRARELLREAGHEHPKLTMIIYELTIPEGPNLMMTVAGYWKSVGAQITMETYEYSSYFSLWQKADPKIIGGVAHNGTASRLPLLLPVSFDKMFTPTKGAMSYFDVPKVGELARQAMKEPDIKKAMGLVRDMLIGAREAQAAMPIANLPNVWGAGPSVPKDLDFGMIRYSWGEDHIRRR
jgi:peptide/nickel transport system substrate-binding protein